MTIYSRLRCEALFAFDDINNFISFLYNSFDDGLFLSPLSYQVGNLGDSNQTYAVDLPGCRSGAYHEADCEIMKEDIAVLYSTINAFAAVMIIVAFVWLRIFELREVMVLDKNTISASDFTVTVENLPASCTAKNLKSHFQKLTKFHIVDVRLAYDDEEDILLFFERGSLFRHRRNLVEMYRYQKMIGKQKEQYFKNLMKDINQVTCKTLSKTYAM